MVKFFKRKNKYRCYIDLERTTIYRFYYLHIVVFALRQNKKHKKLLKNHKSEREYISMGNFR